MTKEPTQPIIERIRKAVVHAGGVRVVAAQSGITKASIYMWLAGDHLPHLDSFLKIARHCDVSPAWLLIGDPRFAPSFVTADAAKEIHPTPAPPKTP